MTFERSRFRQRPDSEGGTLPKFMKFLTVLLMLVAAGGVVACGDDDDDDEGGGGGSGEGGGELVVASVGPDNADPVLFQTVQAVQVFQLAHVPLLTYAHEEGTDAGSELVPGLAEDMPEESNNGKTYKFKLRE